MGKQSVAVRLDFREQDAGYPMKFAQHDDVESTDVEELEIGDMILDDEVIIERKDVGDFVKSMLEGRIDDQIARMYDEFGAENSYLVVSGSLSDVDQYSWSNVNEAAVRGYVASLSARWNQVPLFVDDADRLVDVVVRIGRKHKESTDRVVVNKSSDLERANDPYVMRAVLQLDGVGRETAKNIVSEYRSLEALTEASKEELSDLPGIGEVRSERILSQLRGDV